MWLGELTVPAMTLAVDLGRKASKTKQTPPPVYEISILIVYSGSQYLTRLMLGTFPCFLLRLQLTFQKETSFRNTITVPNCLDPDQTRHSVGPDLGLNLFQRFSAFQ